MPGIVAAESVRADFVDGTMATIPAAVLATSESANFQKAARDIVSLAASEGFDYFKIEHTDAVQSHNEQLTVTKEEVEYFDLPEKWKLSDGERSFPAAIADEDLARVVDSGRIHGVDTTHSESCLKKLLPPINLLVRRLTSLF